ncbi:MAG: alcohol dehydrogenase catalytic domain-containing protein [Planctomycetaceae bacterium]|jgi:L-iditol 2-dehydrogenase|nr:alcohol dehydrogenase catalytic domain-containing protein [Planctomycetaceae bacterium]
MQAIVYYAPGDIRVEDIPKPQLREGELLIHIDACAVCGTDLKSKHHGNPRIKAPLVMGHEFTGIVEEISSSAVGTWNIGDRIVMATSISCGECYYCRNHFRNLCTNLAPMSFSYPGGMAEYVAIPALALRGGHVIKVPVEVSSAAGIKAEWAALAEPTSCAVNSVQQCHIQSGDTVLVMGAGPMGLLNAVVAKAFGAKQIIMSELNELRRNQAKNFEIDFVVDPAKDNLNEVVQSVTKGVGADVVIVAAPAAQPQEQALSFVRKQGTVCLFASLPVGKNMLNIDSRLIHYGEIRLIGSSDSTPEHVKKAVELIVTKKIPAEKIASHLLPLHQIEQAFELMTSGEALRVVLIPPQST